MLFKCTKNDRDLVLGRNDDDDDDDNDVDEDDDDDDDDDDDATSSDPYTLPILQPCNFAALKLPMILINLQSCNPNTLAILKP